MKPSERLREYHEKNFNLLKSFFGHSSNVRVSKNMMVMKLISAIALVMVINGIYKSLGNTMKMIHTIVPIPFAIKVAAQTANYFLGADKKILHVYDNKLVNFVTLHEKNLNFLVILDKGFNLIRRLVKSFTILLAIVYQIPTVNSIITSLIRGEAIYAFNAILPWIDEKSALGFCLNTLIIWMMIFIVYMCHIGITSTQTFVILEVIPQVDIFELKLKELGEKISKNGAKIQNPLTEIIKHYVDYNDYVASIQDCVQLTLFFIVFINSIGIAISVVIMCKWSLINGCAVMIVLICEVAIPCILGSIVEHQNERICKAIYDFPFYNLDVADQKILLQLLTFAQDSANLYLPFFGSVNLELLTNVLNGGYSYFTYIKSFL